jgi:Mrp family chromosome partitioning ATPase/capsular polysaccharide biosynthesis protein
VTSPYLDRASSTEGSDVRRYLGALRQHAFLIIFLVVLGVGASFLVSETSAKRYKASADVVVTPVSSSDSTFVGINVFRDSSDQSRAVLTLARFLSSRGTALLAKQVLHSPLSASSLLSRISVQPIGQADIVSITATAPTPTAASAIANGFAQAMIRQRNAAFQAAVATQITRIRQYLKTLPSAVQNSTQAVTLQQRIAQLVPLRNGPDPSLSIGNPATPPTSPSWPRPKLAAAIAFLAALLLASALAIGLESWNPHVRDEEEILFQYRLPILSRVPRLKRTAAASYLAGHEPLPPASWEAYRRLRVSLDQAVDANPGRTTSIVVTSSQPGEAKTMTSLSLAMSFASAGRKVVLVDADLRHPMIASTFGIAPPRGGIEAALDSRTGEQYLVRPGGHPYLSLLLTRPENATIIDTITPERVRELIERLSVDADIIVFDTAPVGEAAETLAFAEAADAVVVAVRLGATRRDRLADTLRVFARQRVALAGVVLTTDRAADASPYDYGYAGPAQPKLRGSHLETLIAAAGPLSDARSGESSWGQGTTSRRGDGRKR